MSNSKSSNYGDRIASIYDDLYDGLDTAGAVEFLTSLVRAGPALELGIGTGRVALPLLVRGVEVHGIDASKEMVARLREKPQGNKIQVTIGNFADVGVEGRFELVYVVFNTFFALTTQQEQVRCFQNVAARLDENGLFVIEAFVPDPTRFTYGQSVECTQERHDRVVLTAARHDGATQRVDAQHITMGEDGIKLYPVHLRYAWPAELDLMAQLAGMRLRHRWGGWHRETFTGSSVSHVSVYELAG